MSLTLAAPELILAIGAMALLMIGVFGDERSNTLVTGLAVAILIGAGAWMLFFGEHGEGYVRIALVENRQRIRQAVRNIKAFLRGHDQAPPKKRSKQAASL